MSFGSSVSVALLLVSTIAGIADVRIESAKMTEDKRTLCDYTEYTAYSLADVAHEHRFSSAIRSNNPPWYRQRMQLFAYTFNHYHWKKDLIWWAIEKDSTHVAKEKVEKVFAEAFEKWGDVIPLKFARAAPDQEPDIDILFVSNLNANQLSFAHQRSDQLILDTYGAKIVINDNTNWSHKDREDYRNLRFAALHEIGHVLGLDASDDSSAIMSAERRGYKTKGDPTLQPDDIKGVQELYGIPADTPPSSPI